MNEEARTAQFNGRQESFYILDDWRLVKSYMQTIQDLLLKTLLRTPTEEGKCTYYYRTNIETEKIYDDPSLLR